MTNTDAPLPEGLSPAGGDNDADEGPNEFVRLWRGFMTARVTIGLVLLGLQSTLQVLGQSRDKWLIVACAVYLAATMATRLLGKPRRLGRTFDSLWVSTVGVDIAAFALLQFVQGHTGINYTPLLALPVLLASVLGSLLPAMGTAAGVALLLLGQALSMSLEQSADAAQLFAQAALTGVGYFLIAFLATRLAALLASEERRSRRSQLAVQVQRQVNALVIESLNDGVLVVDLAGMVWAANPAACRLLGRAPTASQTPFELSSVPEWRDLGRLTALSFTADRPQRASLVFKHAGAGAQPVEVRTRMTATGDGGGRLCVMFLQDRREMEARMRTEKLASMGRMSTAVAHEIRNPLAAIVQANALLEEDVEEPRLKRLTQMVQQNARRLEKIVDEVLDISRVQGGRDESGQAPLRLNDAVARICGDWSRHTASEDLLKTDLSSADPEVAFDAEHLRRVLVNLLDNARRYASGQAQAIQVWTRVGAGGNAVLGIWSDGQPMEQSVERHLFEPFFSSESRSTGLGLYICRELCERHGATIVFERGQRPMAGALADGNEFRVTLESALRPVSGDLSSDRIPATPWLQNRP